MYKLTTSWPNDFFTTCCKYLPTKFSELSSYRGYYSGPVDARVDKRYTKSLPNVSIFKFTYDSAKDFEESTFPSLKVDILTVCRKSRRYTYFKGAGAAFLKECQENEMRNLVFVAARSPGIAEVWVLNDVN